MHHSLDLSGSTHSTFIFLYLPGPMLLRNLCLQTDPEAYNILFLLFLWVERLPKSHKEMKKLITFLAYCTLSSLC